MPPRPPKYIGVSKSTSGRHQQRSWKAQVKVHGRLIVWPRRFATAAEAARLYDLMAIYTRGPAVPINFDGQPPVGILKAEVKAFLDEKGVLPECYRRGEEPQVEPRIPLI